MGEIAHHFICLERRIGTTYEDDHMNIPVLFLQHMLINNYEPFPVDWIATTERITFLDFCVLPYSYFLFV